MSRLSDVLWREIESVSSFSACVDYITLIPVLDDNSIITLPFTRFTDTRIQVCDDNDRWSLLFRYFPLFPSDISSSFTENPVIFCILKNNTNCSHCFAFQFRLCTHTHTQQTFIVIVCFRCKKHNSQIYTKIFIVYGYTSHWAPFYLMCKFCGNEISEPVMKKYNA